MKRISLVAIVFLATTLSASAKDKNVGKTMSAPEAQAWVETNVHPVLLEYANQDKGVQTLRRYVYSLVKANGEQKVAFVASYEYGKDPRALMESDNSTGKWVVYIFAPALRDAKAKLDNQQDFADKVTVAAAHEMRHIETAYLGLDRVTDEAQVAGWTIVELIRPLAALNRKPFPELLQSSERLSIDYRDNYTDPRWVAAVANAR